MMQRLLVLRSRLIRGVTLSRQHYQFDQSSHFTGLVGLFLSQIREVHTIPPHYRYKDRTAMGNDEHMSVFRNSNTNVTGQKNEPGHDRNKNRRKNKVSYKQRDYAQDSDHSDYHPGGDHSDNHPGRDHSDNHPGRDHSDNHPGRDHSDNHPGIDNSDYHSRSKDNHNVIQHYNEQKEVVQSPEFPDANESEGDTFGNLSNDLKTVQKWLQDENFDKPLDLEKPHRRLSVENRRHPQEWYFKQIVAMGKEGKVLKAIAVLDDWMLVRDRVMPNEIIYTTVIGIIGRTGNATLAFKYFRKMRDYGLKPSDATYTALFNACSNCPDKRIALKNGKDLRNYMRRSEVIPNMITYNAIIKMFGRFGDLPNAFLTADEAMSNRRAADSFFFGSLLSAAISDKREGLLYAIEVWRRMKIMRFQPDLFHYKLMLHAIKECGLGSEEQQRILLQSYVPYKQLKVKQRQIGTKTEIATLHTSPQDPECPERTCYGDLQQEKVLPRKSHRQTRQKKESQLELRTGPVPNDVAVSLDEQVNTSLPSVAIVPSHENPDTVTNFPDLLNPKETFSQVLSLGNISNGEDKLLLMGGIQGFLRRMEADDVSPDITVFTWLVQMTRGKEDEEIILSAFSKGNIKADPTFLNALIRNKSRLDTYADAKTVLQLFTKYKVVPNKQTYGSLMYCTRNPNEAREILDSMENAGLVPDIKTFTLLFGKEAGAFGYKKSLLKKMDDMNVKPNMYFLQTIERQLQNIRNQILLEKSKNIKNNKPKSLEVGLEDFQVFYKKWLLKTKIAKKPRQMDNYRKKKVLTSGSRSISTTT